MCSQTLKANVDFLINPTKAEITRLAELQNKYGNIIPLAIIYKRGDPSTVITGIPESTWIRKGLHGGLLIAAGIAENVLAVQDLKDKRKYSALTLFIELVEGTPQLSYHARNSIRSTINVGIHNESGIPVDFDNAWQDVVRKTSVRVAAGSVDLIEKIDKENKKIRVGSSRLGEQRPELKIEPKADFSNESQAIREYELSKVEVAFSTQACSEPKL